MHTALRAFRKAATGTIAASAFVLHQTFLLTAAAQASPADIVRQYDADYLGFVVAVQQFQWRRGLQLFGLVDEREVIMMTYDVMNHPGRPKDFTLADLGEPGCGLPGGHHPGGQNAGACHAALRDDEQGKLPKPKKGLVPDGCH
jgi:hypothetical protein